MDAVAVKGLDFSYGNTRILRNINFTIPEGRFAVLLGPNGAGKSTLLKLMLGELPLNGQRGRIELLGQEIRQFKDWQKVSYVSQNGMASCQNFPASVEELVQADLYAQIGRFRFAGRKEKEQVRGALNQVGMGDFAKRMIGRLSGGQDRGRLLGIHSRIRIPVWPAKQRHLQTGDGNSGIHETRADPQPQGTVREGWFYPPSFCQGGFFFCHN